MSSERRDATTPSIRERELELALARIEKMSRPLPVTRQGAIVSYGKAECGSLEEAAAIAREALGGN